MDPNAYIVDDSRWPLVRIIVPAKAPDAPEFERYLARLDVLLARRQPHAVVVDALAAGALPTAQRERLRNHRRAAFLEAQLHQRAMAFVVGSALQRAILGAILWLAPEPCPTRTFATVVEAETWTLSCLDRARAA